MTDHVHRTVHDRIARIVLDRPKLRNALTEEMWTSLEDAIHRCRADEVRVVILTGAGGSFCAGNDIRMLQAGQADPGWTSDFHRRVDRVLVAIRDLPMPTIAAVDGSCFGAGLMLATACDLRVAGPSAAFCAPPAKLGLVYGIEPTRALVRLVGPARAKDLLFTARVVAAPEAFGWGLVDRMAEGAAMEAAEALAREIGGWSGASHRASKRLVEAAMGKTPTEVWMDDLRDRASGTAEFAEGHAAFAERRSPRF